MPTLPEIQQQFFAGIFDRDTAIIDALLPSDTLMAKDRLAIYRGSIFGLYTNALSAIYPVCERLFGEQFFDALCDRYIPEHPSTSPNLQDYGQSFAEFLQGFEPVASLPYMPDVARLEWAWHQAFHARSHEPLDSGRLSRVKEKEMEHIVFQLAPGATLLTSNYPVDRIWQCNQADVHDPAEIELDGCTRHLLIWRQGLEMRIDPLNENQWLFLKTIEAQTSLSEIAGTYPGLNLHTLLQTAMENAWLVNFHLQNTGSTPHE